MTRPNFVAAGLGLLAAIQFAQAQSSTAPHGKAENPIAHTNIDTAFSAGLEKLKQITGFIEDPPAQSSTDWQPNLQLLVGFKALEGSKRTVHFVELTTVQPPVTNATGQPWQPALRTNHWAWSPTNKARFISSNYPVRVRVFDEAGRLLKGGQTPMAWGMLTNGLMDLCRLSLETYGNQTNRASTGTNEKKGTNQTTQANKTAAPARPSDGRLMLATGGGFLWMFGMFRDLQTVPTVAAIWAKAQCAVRWPSAWAIITAPIRGLSFELMPRTQEVTRADISTMGGDEPNYSLPLDLKSGQRSLSCIEIVVGPAHGAEMLLAGIRTIHARHPTKPKQEFLTQVLATGRAREP